MVNVKISGVSLQVEKGTLLADVLPNAGVHLAHPCGRKGFCRKCLVKVNGENVLSCRYRIDSDIVVELPEEGEIFSESGAVETSRMTDHMCYALDIGTTTLALALVSLDEGQIVRVITRTNPQKVHGADVMTRIDFCRENGPDELHSLLIGTVNEMIDSLACQKPLKLYAAGNATMLHLFWNVDCTSMGMAPYTPVFLDKKTGNGEQLGLRGIEEVETLPSIASFVGADIVAGLHYVGCPKNDRYQMLIDLGTNAEIVLFSNSSAICSAAAAGPCFEGANISCGMSATSGAIYAYAENQVRTIADAPARGICGTGLIDVVAYLLQRGFVDETGYMEDETFEVAPGVHFIQADVRQYQLAKSAIYSAIQTLVKIQGISFEDIETLFISGGFSSKIDIDHAVLTGLLPKELKEKCVSINNSCLLGTARYASDPSAFSQKILKAEYIDLAAHPLFSDLFVSNMLFEET